MSCVLNIASLGWFIPARCSTMHAVKSMHRSVKCRHTSFGRWLPLLGRLLGCPVWPFSFVLSTLRARAWNPKGWLVSSSEQLYLPQKTKSQRETHSKCSARSCCSKFCCFDQATVNTIESSTTHMSILVTGYSRMSRTKRTGLISARNPRLRQQPVARRL